MAGCAWDVGGLGGDGVEGCGEEAEGYGFSSGEDVDAVEGAEGVEGLETWEEDDSDAEGFLGSARVVVCFPGWLV